MSANDSFLFLFSRLQEELNRLITEFMEQGAGDPREHGWTPNVDVLEAEKTIEILAEVPGLRASDLRLEIAGNVVTLSGEKLTEYAGSGALRFDRVERFQGVFRRQIVLDRPVNGSLAEARLEDGVLVIRLPRVEDKRSQRRLLTIEEPSAGKAGRR